MSDIAFSQTYPYDTASFTSATSSEQTRSQLGYNAGADVAYYFSDAIGIGFVARFRRASIDFGSADGSTVGVDVGGLQTGGGLRLRF